jgi:hypothetical protein
MIKTTISEKIIDFLKEDLIQNLNMLGIIKNIFDIEIYVDNVDNPRGVLLKNGYFNYIYTKEDSFIDDICNNLCEAEGFYGFSGLEENIKIKLAKNFTSHWETPCDLYYLPKENFNPTLRKNIATSVDIKDAETIDFYYDYKSNESLRNIKNDISSRPSSAIYKDGEIASWVIIHNDNSMGIMHTKEEHRGKGYAVDVTIDLCEKILNQGKIPFLQIVQYNSMSPGLAKKCGFVKYGRAIWFGGIKGKPKYFYEMSETIYSNIKRDFGDEELFLKYISPKAATDFLFSLIDFEPLNNNYSDFEINEIVEDRDLEAWCSTASKGYELPANCAREFELKLKLAIQKDRSKYKLFLGSLKGTPVSTIGFYMIENEVPGICYQSTLPELTDKEFDNILINEVLTKIKKDKWELIIIRSPQYKKSFLKSLGGIEL